MKPPFEQRSCCCWAACAIACLAMGCELLEPEAPATPPPEPADNTEVIVTPMQPALEATPSAEPAATAPTEPPEAGVHETSEQTRGRLAPGKIAKVLDAHSERFTQCYADARAEDPSLEGRVTLLIVITPEGNVGHAEVMQDTATLLHAGVHACLVKEALTRKFETPVGGRVVTQYPLEFKPAPAAPDSGGAASKSGPAEPSLPAEGPE